MAQGIHPIAGARRAVSPHRERPEGYYRDPPRRGDNVSRRDSNPHHHRAGGVRFALHGPAQNNRVMFNRSVAPVSENAIVSDMVSRSTVEEIGGNILALVLNDSLAQDGAVQPCPSGSPLSSFTQEELQELRRQHDCTVSTFNMVPVGSPEFQAAYKLGNFTAEPASVGRPQIVTRYLKITGLSARDFENENGDGELFARIKSLDTAKPMVACKKNPANSVGEFRFASVDAARAFYIEVRHLRDEEGVQWSITFETPDEFDRQYHSRSSRGSISSRSSAGSPPRRNPRYAHSDTNTGADREGELSVIVDVLLDEVQPENQAAQCQAILIVLRSHLFSKLQEFGKVAAMQLHKISEGKLEVRVEMDDIMVADKVVRYFSSQGRGIIDASRSHLNFAFIISAEHWDKAQCPESWISCDHVRGPNGNDNNRVNRERIITDEDVRTSVMLRDLPNRMSFFEINRLLEWVSPGQYDFSYLRIDFENQHNVGYVFINFIDARSIVSFMDRVVGHRWQIYNSEKVAQLSYANIQGRECLIERFRNSAVSNQWPPFRPKLWKSIGDVDYNHLHPNEEEKFPMVTNRAKFVRSLDNQAAVGLFAPGHRNPGPPSTNLMPFRRTMIRNDGVPDLFNITASSMAVHEVVLPHTGPYPCSNYYRADAPAFIPGNTNNTVYRDV